MMSLRHACWLGGLRMENKLIYNFYLEILVCVCVCVCVCISIYKSILSKTYIYIHSFK